MNSIKFKASIIIILIGMIIMPIKGVYASDSTYNIDLKSSVKRSVYNELLSVNSEDEPYYSLRDKLNNIVVKNQKMTGLCWAFALTSAMETTVSNKYHKTVEYSPLHAAYSIIQITGRNDIITNGNYTMQAISYGVSGNGLVYESDLPFNKLYSIEEENYLPDINKVNLNQKARGKIRDATKFPTIIKERKDDAITYTNGDTEISFDVDLSDKEIKSTYSNEEVEAIRRLIKKHIKEDGGILATVNTATYYSEDGKGWYDDGEPIKYAFFGDEGFTEEDQELAEEETKEEYDGQDEETYNWTEDFNNTTHEVVIVGWDDNYSKENFKTGRQPVHDGAYIVLNSWGEENGDGGYNYVSYDDYLIESELYGINDIEIYEDNKKIEYNTYQYDNLEPNAPVRCLGETRLLGANVFERKNKNKKEYLNEVGLWIDKTEGVNVYVNSSNEDLNNGTLVASYTGSNALEVGYHTLTLASPVELTGDKYAIIVEYISNEGASVPASSFGTTMQQGQSYFSVDGKKWEDLYSYNTYEDVGAAPVAASIKAFTTEAEQETIMVQKIELDKSELTMEVGEKTNLVAKANPENATYGKIIWKSSNEKVATVTENGIITAVSKGKTTITAYTEDWKSSASCELTVKEKQNFDDDIYTKQNTQINEVNNTNNQQAEKKTNNNSIKTDNTIANKALPKTGKSISTWSVVTIILFVSLIAVCVLVKKYIIKRN